MGKRKSKKRVVRKVVDKLATAFDCPFCNHSLTVECKMYGCRACVLMYRSETLTAWCLQEAKRERCRDIVQNL